LWDVLNSKYLAVERLQTWKNLAHDADLVMILKRSLKSLKDNIAILEDMMIKFSVKSPDQSRSFSSFTGGEKYITDEFIALDIFLYLQEHIENLSRVLRSSTTNDALRATFKKMALKTIDELNTMINYLTLKGWLSTPPLYQHIPYEVDEKLGLPEATNLWDQLTLRYDNIKTTEIFHGIVHDLDFKAILGTGIKILQKQAQLLEKEIRHFGLPLPRKPSKISLTPTNTEILSDDYMYRILANALQGAAIMHAQAYKEAVVNNRIRDLFKQFLIEELNFIDNLIKFGKLKGWFSPIPTYGP
jgi:hypothetical protein